MTAIINLFLLIVLVGFIMGVINGYVPMPRGIRALLNLLVLLFLVVYVLQFFGFISPVLPFVRFFS